MALDVQGSDSLFWKTGLDLGGLKSGVAGAQGMIAGLMKNITAMDVFAGLGISAGIVFTKVSKMAYNFSKEFEHSMKEVQTISDAVKADFEGVSDEVIQLSRIVPDNANALSKALYQIVSAGYDGAKAMDILRESSELAVATVTNTFTAADALTYVMNAYGKAAGNAADISDKLFTIIRLGKVKMEELGPTLSMVTGLAAQTGLQFDELATIYTEAVKKIQPHIVSTGIRGITTAMLRVSQGTGDAADAARELGIEFDIATLKSKGFKYILNEIIEKTKGNEAALMRLFPNVRGLIGLLAVMTDEGEGYNKTLEKIQSSTGATKEAFGIMVKDTTNELAILHNNIMAKLKPLGDAILGQVNNIASGLNDMLKSTGDATKDMIVSLEETVGVMESQRTRVNDLIDTISELMELEKLDEDQTYQLKAAKEALAIFYPDLIGSINDETTATEFLTLAKETMLEVDKDVLEMKKSIAEANYIVAQSELDLYELQEDTTGQRVKETEKNLTKQRQLLEQQAREIKTFMAEGALPVMGVYGGTVMEKTTVEAFKQQYADMGIYIDKLVDSQASEAEILELLKTRVDDYKYALAEHSGAVGENIRQEQTLKLTVKETEAIFKAYEKAVENLTDTEVREQAKSINELRKSFEAKAITVEEYTKKLGMLKIELQLYPDLVKQIDAQLAAIPTGEVGVTVVPGLADTEAMEKAAELQDRIYEDILEKMKTFEEKKADIEADYDTARAEARERLTGDERQAMLDRLAIAEEEQIELLRIDEETAELAREVKETEMDLETRFRTAQYLKREQDFIKTLEFEIEYFKGNEEIKKKMIEFLSKIKSKTADIDYQNFRRMNDKELQDFIDKKRKEKEILDEFSQDYKIADEQLREALNESWDRQGKRIQDIGNAIKELGNVITSFDEDVGRLVSDVGGIVSQVGNLSRELDSGNIFTQIGAGFGIVGGIIDLFKGTEEIAESIETSTDKINKLLEKQMKILEYATGERRIRVLTKALTEWLQIIGLGMVDIDELLRKGTLYFEGLEATKAQAGDIDEYRDMFIELQSLLTGTTASSIADSIARGFMEGKVSAQDFSDDFEGMMTNAMIESFKGKIISNILGDWYDQFASMANAGLTPDEIEDLRSTWNQMMESAKDTWEGFQEIAEGAGFDLLGETEEETKKGLRGAIKGITEDTAGILAGQFNAVRINILQTLNETRLINVNMGDMIDIAINNWEANERTARNTSVNPDILSVLRDRLPRTNTKRAIESAYEFIKSIGG